MKIANSTVTVIVQPSVTELDQVDNGTMQVIGSASQQLRLLDWGNDAEFIAVDVRCPAADVLVLRANFLALRSNFSWKSAAFSGRSEVTLSECNVRGKVTSDTPIKARNSNFEPALEVKGYKQCFAKDSVGCDPKASACRDDDVRAGLRCWCPHGETGEFRGTSCETQNVTCPPGWQFDAKKQGEEPCVPCDGLKGLYSLGNTCEQCPKGADCTLGRYDVRPSMDKVVNHGVQQGQPFYLTCVSKGTLETLTARGVNITALIAIALRDNAEQVNMGHTAKECGADATLVSTPRDAKGDARTDKAVFYACPNPDACSSTRVHADGSADCPEEFRGPLCALCRPGYAWSEGYKCTLCTGGTLGLLVGGGIVAGIVFAIAFYAFLLHPLFEADGTSLGTRVMARITRLAARCCRRPASQGAEAPQGESAASTAGGMAPTSQRAMRAMMAAKDRLGELKRLRDQLVAAVGDGKLGSMFRCLVGFTQVLGYCVGVALRPSLCAR